MNEFIDRAIADLRERIAKLEALKGAEPEVMETLAHVRRIWSDDRAWIWLLRHNTVLGGSPIDLLLRGQVEPVRTLLVRIEYGIAS
ncbi:antitoxin Xre/MbcA/ParS toxin-binding domain-containing protein [Microvirga sp. VF16]|uniref:antitoxin Xre/MbcA/ParS toxin-binding domain-containing protein n=1 Tax=Microvirga sp. VF16 TaxID=2807101 RepID=UPI00193E7B04|nr:DUF2384 domain-containing protein [Microvirga sp. VF16]